MKTQVTAAFSLFVLGCDQRATPIIAYQRPLDGVASVLPLELVGIRSCATSETIAGRPITVRLPTERCYKMLPAQRYRGVWLDEYEGSIFLEGVTTANAAKAELARRIKDSSYDSYEWLEMRPTHMRSSKSRLFFVDFIGQRTAYRGVHGHGGGAKTVVVVKRLITKRLLYTSPVEYIGYELEATVL